MEEQINLISTFALAFEKSGEKDGSLAQLNRAFDYGSKGCRFESCRGHQDKTLNFGKLSVFYFYKNQK